MSVTAIPCALICDPSITPLEKTVYSVLAAMDLGRPVVVSIEDVADRCGYRPVKVRQAVVSLVERCWLEQESLDGGALSRFQVRFEAPEPALPNS